LLLPATTLIGFKHFGMSGLLEYGKLPFHVVEFPRRRGSSDSPASISLPWCVMKEIDPPPHSIVPAMQGA